MSTYNEIRLEIYDRLQLSSAPPAAVITRLSRSVNRWHRKILTTAGLKSLRNVQITQASVADTFIYAVALKTLETVTERDNDWELTKRTREWWKLHFPDPTEFTGTPTNFVPLGFTRAQRRPANASELFVISTSASDTQTVRVEAIRTDGFPVSLSVSLTGTTGVSLDSTVTDVVDVVDFFLASNAVGTVTLREDSGAGTVLSTIPIGASYQRFLRYALAPTPSSAITYFLDGVAAIVDMSQDTDQPLWDEDFHDILIDGPVYIEYRDRGRVKEAQWLKDEIAQRTLELKNWVWMRDIQPDPGEEVRRRRTFQQTISTPIL